MLLLKPWVTVPSERTPANWSLIWSHLTIFESKSAKEYTKKNPRNNIWKKIRGRVLERRILFRGFSFQYSFADFLSTVVMPDHVKISWHKRIFERKSTKEYSKENPRKLPGEKICETILQEYPLKLSWLLMKPWVTVSSENTTVNWFFTWSRITILERKSSKNYSKENPRKNIRKKIRIKIFERKSAQEYSKENHRNNIRQKIRERIFENMRKNIRKKIRKRIFERNLRKKIRRKMRERIFKRKLTKNIWVKISSERIFERKSAKE